MLVTVVTPSLNGMAYLDRCIDSVEAQSSQEVEVEHIFVDGGSTDGTPEYAQQRNCTVLTRSERNIHVAINKGMRHASGSLVGVLGCDDVLVPGALDTLTRRFHRERLPWLVGGCQWIDAGGRPRGVHPAPPTFLPTPALASLRWSPFPAISTYFAAAFIAELGYFDTTYEFSGDYDLALRARRLSRYSRIEEVLSSQRRHGANMSMERAEQHYAELARINQSYGSPSQWRRDAASLLVRGVLNVSNPRWYIAKRADKWRRAVTQRA